MGGSGVGVGLGPGATEELGAMEVVLAMEADTLSDATAAEGATLDGTDVVAEAVPTTIAVFRVTSEKKSNSQYKVTYLCIV